LDEWLKAGVFENDNVTEFEQGVPQGSAISPIIFNCVMNGIETEILKTGAFPIRYADDIFVFGKTKKQLEKAKEIIPDFLKTRGLEINDEKTRFVPIEVGVDILGFNIREYSDETRTKNPKMKTKKGILLTKPSKRSVENFRKKISEVLEKRKKSSAHALILELNPDDPTILKARAAELKQKIS
jgi:RNA-directed DNA polymerase